MFDLINEKIKFSEVILIHNDQKRRMPTSAAQRIADEEGLDLICVAPKAEIPVCKLGDAQKIAYEERKRQKENKKNQVQIKVKEIQISPSIAANDMKIKISAARRMIVNDRNRVKITMRLRGREISLANSVAIPKMNEMLSLCDEFSKIISPPKLEGRTIISVIGEK